MNIEERLKLYKKNKAEVETTLQRISVWKDILITGDLKYLVWAPSCTLGMPKAPGHNTASPTEKEVCSKEVTREIVENWINDDESRIFMKKLEIQQIESALECLTYQQKYIIECKYFENWVWRTIEINFNEKFKREYITSEGIRKINKEAVAMLNEILLPFYNQTGKN